MIMTIAVILILVAAMIGLAMWIGDKRAREDVRGEWQRAKKETDKRLQEIKSTGGGPDAVLQRMRTAAVSRHGPMSREDQARLDTLRGGSGGPTNKTGDRRHQ